MLVVGLTGGIGAGKSTIASFFKAKGAVVIDADEVAKKAITPKSEVWKRLVKHFGQSILLKNKSIDRKRLGEVVFSNQKRLKTLDTLTHPAIVEAIKEKIAQFRQSSSEEKMIVVDAPLLAEAGLLPLVDKVVVVTAKKELRLERLKKLGFSGAEAKARFKSQISDKKRFKFAHYILQNDGSLEELKKKADRLWEALRRQA